MNEIITDTQNRYIFMIVNTVPTDYVVWNVNFREMFNGRCIIPLVQEDKNYHVNTKSMKALEVSVEEFNMMIEATRWFHDLKHAKTYIKRYSNSANVSVQRRIKYANMFIAVMDKYYIQK